MRTIMTRLLWPIVALAGLAVTVAGAPVQAARPRVAPRAGGTLTVYAAASLKEAFTTIGKSFDAANGSATRFQFGGSDTLATQITQGAPADVFASANQAQMKVVQVKGLIDGTPAVFARNRLVAIVPRNNPGHIYNLADLGNPGVRLVLAAPSVPVGKYARAAVTVMASDAAFGPDFQSRVTANIVSNETDVKAVVTKVSLGEADAGVVYVTDVTPNVAPRLTTITIPGPYNQVATYPIGIVKGGHNGALAERFTRYVLSSLGQSVLRGRGFLNPGAPEGAYAASLQVAGLVSHPQTLTVSDLRRFQPTRVTATQRTGIKILGTATYTGALLNSVVQAAAPISNTSYKNDPLRQFVTVVGSDNYQATVALAEILPTFGHEQVLLAYTKNGRPLSNGEGAIELIVPGDTLAGRDVKHVVRLVVGTPAGTP